MKIRDLIRSPPVPSASGLPVYVAASPAAPFSTSVGMTEREAAHGVLRRWPLNLQSHAPSYLNASGTETITLS
jgi:hypothetical protein